MRKDSDSVSTSRVTGVTVEEFLDFRRQIDPRTDIHTQAKGAPLRLPVIFTHFCHLVKVTVKKVEKDNGEEELVVDKIDENGGHLAVIHGDTGHFSMISPVRSDSVTGVLTDCPWCDPLD